MAALSTLKVLYFHDFLHNPLNVTLSKNMTKYKTASIKALKIQSSTTKNQR